MDATPADAPTNPFDFPTSAATAVGTPSNISSAANGGCSSAGGALNCVVPVMLSVGVIDLYILVFDGQNGSGSLMYGSVTTLRVNSNGTFSAAPPSTASSPNTLQANPVCGVPSPSPSPTVSPTIADFAIPGATYGYGPSGLTEGPDGNMWFTAVAGPYSSETYIYGYVTPGGSFKEFNANSIIPQYPGSNIGQIASGAGRTLWFAYTVVTSTYYGTPNTYGAYMIQASTAGNVMTSLTENTSCNVANTAPEDCATFDVVEPGASGTVLTSLEYPFSSSEADSSSLYTITTNGSLTSLYNPDAGGNFDLLQVDGGVWASWGTNYRCGVPTVCNTVTFITSSGAVTSYPLPGSYQPISGQDLTLGPDGAPWIALVVASNSSDLYALGRIASNASITLFPVGTNVGVSGITTGADGALWFTEAGSNAIGRMTTTGAVMSYPIPTASSLPQRIVSGPNRTLWFTEAATGKIGKVSY
jgi:hypothetical protein